MPDTYIIQLLKRLIGGSISTDEKEQLADWVNSSDEEALNDVLRITWDEFETADSLDKEKADQLLQSILSRAKESEPAKVIALKSRSAWRKIAVAASVIAVAGILGYFLLWQRTQLPEKQITENVTPHDVKAPDANRAMITLSNGQKIFLDSAGNGTLATQNNINIVKTGDGKIVYSEASGSPPLEGLGEANTLTNPRGSKVINMTLSDGSRVWLNAGSSITYPVAFVGDERKVSITGEAYFEASPSPSKGGGKRPFIVSGGSPFGGQGAGWTVTVLGTHFNVNAYDDEDAIRVTLLEGSVRLSSPLGGGREGAVMLKPGDQGIVQHSTGVLPSALSVVPNANLEQVMAWKNNKFRFDGDGLPSIMRQLSRWYDVEVQYELETNRHFTGIISRDVNVSEVLKMLEMTGVMHFKVEGRKVMVTK